MNKKKNGKHTAKHILQEFLTASAGIIILYFTLPEFQQAVNTCVQEVAIYIPLATAAASGGWQSILKRIKK